MDDEVKDLGDQLFRGELTRRDFIQRGLALGMTASAVGLLLYNAAPVLAAMERHQSPSPRMGGTLRVADPGPTPGSLDPAVQQDTATIGICHNIYNFLVRIDEHLIPYPDLATKWSASADGLTWTLPLRKGVKFHSGKSFTAADAIYSLNRIKNLGLGGASLLTNVSSMEMSGPYTLVIHVKTPTPDLPNFLADYHMCIIENGFDPNIAATSFAPKKGYAGGYVKFTSGPSGTGPFMLKDFVPGDHATLVRNPHYFEAPYPYLDTVKFLYLPQPSTQVAAVQSGQVDFITVLTPAQVTPLLNAPGIKITTLPTTAFLNMRMRADRKPFSDVRVRQAFKYIVDRKAVDQVLVNGMSPLGNDTPISPGFGQWYSNIPVRPHDPMKAQALLSAAGYTKEKPLTVKLYAANSAGALQFATAYQQMAGDVPNVAISIVSDTLSTYYTYWLKADFAITSWGARTVPQEILDLLYREKAVWNEGHYYNPRLEGLLTATGSELNTAKRKSLYRQIETLLSDDGPSIIPSYNVFALPLRTRVQGFTPLPDTFHYYKTAWVTS